jgi:hypothetical protein
MVESRRRALGAGRGALASAALLGTLALVPTRSSASVGTTMISADVVGRHGPAGVMLFAGGARRWTQEDGRSPLEQGRYVQLGASVGVNPAYAQGSVAAEWVPVAVLQLRLQYDAFAFFGANGALLQLPSKDAAFGRDDLDALSGEEEARLGHRVMFSPVLRAKLGPIVLRNQTELDWYRLSGTDGWYYEWEHDTLLDESDWLIANGTTVFFELWDGPGEATFLAGPTYDLTRAGGAGITRQRAGVSLYFAPTARWLGLHRVRVHALAGVNLSDRNREGQPFAVLGLGGDLDLAPGRATKP